LFIALSACQATTSTNTQERLNAVLWMQTSAEYHALTTSIYKQATLAVDVALAKPEWTAATEQTDNFSTLPPAIILDIDETVLDNLPYQAQLIKTNSEFNPTSWNQWTQQASAQPVPGASEFLHYAESKGVTIFYVTNRDTKQESDTRKNLAHVKLPLRSDMDVVLTKNENGWNTSDKSARRAYVAKNFRIIALAGDDFGDFDSGAYGTPEQRLETAKARTDYWGTKWFLIPNPVYGSWEASLYSHNYKIPPADILQEKFRKLVTPVY
jgi:5'-nucleotidase (lipoprotein e(P4) family)